ncbi:Lipopolysaccharide-modifying protein [Penicillium longicatenatum]|uniref:Lipopolysaccharide-modifying protein n=1 Tax=Penicillium longicatenatum TaxID=1561947 RepID=UPI002547588A|nr:Lipopolysaccharide-modifying protein [Penicillium longicatenatum]KAJ5631492.1 Lipopolysaccharide-modifying protein [Penicillium longicatenatum]
MGKQKSPSSNCTPSPGKGKHKPPDIITSPVSLQDQDLFVGSPVHTPKRCWKDELIWDLDGVRNLRDLLILWIDSGVTASNIGCFLENVLYDRDEHLDGRLTRMVNNHETHTQIALDLLKHYQARDEAGKPLWELKASQLGNEYSRSGQPSASSTPSTPSEPNEPSSKAGTKRLKITVPLFFRMLSKSPLEPEPTQTSKRNSCYQVPAPKSLRTFKKPYFMNNVEPIREIEEVSDGFSGKACWSFNISDDLTMLTIAERRALMANTGALPPSFAAEIHDSTPVVDISSLYTANHLQIQGLEKEHERTLSGGSRQSFSSSDYGD